MNCLRCNGLAVSDDSIAVEIGSSSDFHGWRCVNCGMIVDDVIHNNRRASQRSRGSGDTERRCEAA
jgi:hypothetical protein